MNPCTWDAGDWACLALGIILAMVLAGMLGMW